MIQKARFVYEPVSGFAYLQRKTNAFRCNRMWLPGRRKTLAAVAESVGQGRHMDLAVLTC